jgi:cyanophycinase
LPSPVPAGFTRGPILFFGALTTGDPEERLLQRFWNEAGAYGSRVIVINVGPESRATAQHYTSLFRDWESQDVAQVEIEQRADAMNQALCRDMIAGTGLLLVGSNPLRMAGLLGGTQLAQTIRRMNAQNKGVAACGSGASILCQHMVAFDDTGHTARPFIHRDLVRFAPGLGLVNRLVLDTREPQQRNSTLSRLLAAVAWNPFLVSLSLQPDTGCVVYPNTTMEVFGDNSALVVDGAAMVDTSMGAAEQGVPVSLLGVQFHILAPGASFTFDTRRVAHPTTEDILRRSAVKAAF